MIQFERDSIRFNKSPHRLHVYSLDYMFICLQFKIYVYSLD